MPQEIKHTKKPIDISRFNSELQKHIRQIEKEYKKPENLTDLHPNALSLITQFSCYHPTTNGIFFPADNKYIFTNQGFIYDIYTFKALRLTHSKIKDSATALLSESDVFKRTFKALSYTLPRKEFEKWSVEKKLHIEKGKKNLLPNIIDNMMASAQAFKLRYALEQGENIQQLEMLNFTKNYITENVVNTKDLNSEKIDKLLVDLESQIFSVSLHLRFDKLVNNKKLSHLLYTKDAVIRYAGNDNKELLQEADRQINEVKVKFKDNEIKNIQELTNISATQSYIKDNKDKLLSKQGITEVSKELDNNIDVYQKRVDDFFIPIADKTIRQSIMSKLIQNDNIYLRLDYFYPNQAITNMLEERGKTKIENMFDGRYISTKQGFIDKVLLDEFCQALATRENKTIKYIDLSYPLFATTQVDELLNNMIENKIKIKDIYLGQAFDYASPEVLEKFFANLNTLEKFETRRCFLKPEQRTAILKGMEKSGVNTKGFIFYNLHGINESLVKRLGVIEENEITQNKS